MRCLLALILFLGLTMTLHADTFVYVSMTPEKKIQIFRLNPKDGKLTAVEAVATDGSPGALAVDPQQKFLFAALRPNIIASLAIDPATGKLKLLSTAALGPTAGAAFVGTDRTGRWLFSASYSGGKVVVHRVKEDGTIQSPAVQTVATAKTAHSTWTDPDNRLLFVPHVTPNAVYQFRFDPATGKLTDAGKAAGGTENAGPRHLAWHPTQKLAFTSDETGSSITAYRLEADGLKPVQTLSTIPSDFKIKNTTAEVKVHPNGKFVWVSNRGHDSLAGFAIDGTTGKLTAIGQTPTETVPWSFAIDPDGRYLMAVGQGSGKLAMYKIDTDTGKLTLLDKYDVGKGPLCVMAVKSGAK